MTAEQTLWISLAIGGAGSTIAAPLIEAGAELIDAKGSVTELIRSHVVAGNTLGIATAGGALAVARARDAADAVALSETEWIVASVGLGLACGVLFSVFLGNKGEESSERTFLATVGIVIFTSGMASGMGVSPILLNAIAGVVVSFLYRRADHLHQTLLTLQGPASIMLLIFAGAMWSPPQGIVWLLPVAYLISRVVSARVGGALSLRAVPEVPRADRLGYGLLGQGALAAAIVMNVAQVRPELSSLALTTVLPPLVLMAPFGARWLKITLADAGDLGRVEEITQEVSTEGGPS
jgi:Kef-type K+ transport system membrane component KefB